MHLNREKVLALSSAVDSGRNETSHAGHSQQWIFVFSSLFSFLANRFEIYRDGGIRTPGPTPVALGGYY